MQATSGFSPGQHVTCGCVEYVLKREICSGLTELIGSVIGYIWSMALLNCLS